MKKQLSKSFLRNRKTKFSDKMFKRYLQNTSVLYLVWVVVGIDHLRNIQEIIENHGVDQFKFLYNYLQLKAEIR